MEEMLQNWVLQIQMWSVHNDCRKNDHDIGICNLDSEGYMCLHLDRDFRDKSLWDFGKVLQYSLIK